MSGFGLGLCWWGRSWGGWGSFLEMYLGETLPPFFPSPAKVPPFLSVSAQTPYKHWVIDSDSNSGVIPALSKSAGINWVGYRHFTKVRVWLPVYIAGIKPPPLQGVLANTRKKGDIFIRVKQCLRRFQNSSPLI